MNALEDAAACPDNALHAVHPTSYIGHGSWAEQMLLTHKQRKCAGCGQYAIWEPIDPAVLCAPAIADNECSRCGNWYDEGALIRTDGKGGWLGECCGQEQQT